MARHTERGGGVVTRFLFETTARSLIAEGRGRWIGELREGKRKLFYRPIRSWRRLWKKEGGQIYPRAGKGGKKKIVGGYIGGLEQEEKKKGRLPMIQKGEHRFGKTQKQPKKGSNGKNANTQNEGPFFSQPDLRSDWHWL